MKLHSLAGLSLILISFSSFGQVGGLECKDFKEAIKSIERGNETPETGSELVVSEENSYFKKWNSGHNRWYELTKGEMENPMKSRFEYYSYQPVFTRFVTSYELNSEKMAKTIEEKFMDACGSSATCVRLAKNIKPLFSYNDIYYSFVRAEILTASGAGPSSLKIFEMNYEGCNLRISFLRD